MKPKPRRIPRPSTPNHDKRGVIIWIPIEFTERSKLISSHALLRRVVHQRDGRNYITMLGTEYEILMFPDYWRTVDTVTDPATVALLRRVKPPKE